MTKDRSHPDDVPHTDPHTAPYAGDIPPAGDATASVPALRGEDTDPVDHPDNLHQDPAPASTRTLVGGTWVALVVGALLLVALLIFILQNQAPVEMNILTWTFEIPAGVAYLLSAITGALIMAMVGGVRMFEYRRKIKKIQKALS
ncbi:LapA family protein [Corynebacterium gallinarum]|uniref:DUF1049 domain-containing protein n=1 Tax=Corynebacterium gallinarum TaxID=2762214 RepID=A0A8I0HN41_9CORY|nr:lipopolysaccharide assembly protein LapA domain-containing protein [Corynebacterium gallinarum]MBD8028808.1 DUF1049 domain-containing protein [Corynebacterium gallinarum]